MRWLILSAFLLLSACDTVEPDVASNDLSATTAQAEYWWVIEKDKSDDPYTKRWVTQKRYTREAIDVFIGSASGERVIGYVVED